MSATKNTSDLILFPLGPFVSMDLGLATAGSAQESKAKKPKQDRDQKVLDKRMEELLKLIAKSCLNAQQQVRLLKSICLEAMKMPSTSQFIGSSKEAIKSFLDAAKEISDPDERYAKLGSIHHHSFNSSLALALSLSEKVTDDQIVKARGHVVQFMEDCKTRSASQNLEIMRKECKYFRYQKTFRKEVMRLEWSMVPGTQTFQINEFIVLMIKHTHTSQAIPLGGIAPRGQLERQLQKFIETGEIDPPKEGEEDY